MQPIAKESSPTSQFRSIRVVPNPFTEPSFIVWCLHLISVWCEHSLSGLIVSILQVVTTEFRKHFLLHFCFCLCQTPPVPVSFAWIFRQLTFYASYRFSDALPVVPVLQVEIQLTTIPDVPTIETPVQPVSSIGAVFFVGIFDPWIDAYDFSLGPSEACGRGKRASWRHTWASWRHTMATSLRTAVVPFTDASARAAATSPCRGRRSQAEAPRSRAMGETLGPPKGLYPGPVTSFAHFLCRAAAARSHEHRAEEGEPFHSGDPAARRRLHLQLPQDR